MKKGFNRLNLFLFLVLVWVPFARSQQDAEFGNTDHYGPDDVNIFTIIPSINVPVVHKSGAMPFDFQLIASQQCDATNAASQNQAYPCNGDFGAFSTKGAVGNGYEIIPASNPIKIGCPNGGFAYEYARWYITVGDSSITHRLPGTDTITLNQIANGQIPQGNCTPTYQFTDVTVDGSGYTVTIGWPTGTLAQTNGAVIGAQIFSVVDRSGRTAAFNATNNNWTYTDTFNNTITKSNLPYTYTDTLGVTEIESSPGSWRGSASGTVKYPDTHGNFQSINLTRSTTAFQEDIVGTCPGHGLVGTFFPVLTIGFPDTTSMSFTYETVPNTSNYTGRVASFTTREGGTISYTYSTPCTSYPNTMTRMDIDGTFSYTANLVTNGSLQYQTTTVLDPAMNKIVYTFNNGDAYFNYQYGISYDSWTNFLTEKDVYQNTNTVQNPQYSLVAKEIYCYNTNTTNCTGANVAYPITQRDVYHYVDSNSTLVNHVTETYDTYGNVLVKTIVDSVTGQTAVSTTVYGTYSNGTCTPLTGIHDKPCTVTSTVGGTQISQAQYSYTAAGFLSSRSTWLCNSCTVPTITTSWSPNNNGTIASVTLPTGQQISYGYTGTGECNSLMPTSTSTTVNGVALNTSAQYDCNSGLVLNQTDVNSNVNTFTYDSMLRMTSDQDQLGFTLNHGYTKDTYTSFWSMTSPSAASTLTETYDGLGRIIDKQTTHGSGYDTVSYGYGYSGIKFQEQSSEPCNTTAVGNTCSLVHTSTSDILGRMVSSNTTNNEQYAMSYSNTDVQIQLSPAPGTEHLKTTQMEFDGMGRARSSCDILTSGGTSCNNAMGGTGIPTSTTYTYSMGTTTITDTRGGQTHTTVYDAAGRTTSVAVPEAGTMNYTWDTVAAGYCDPSDTAYTSKGNLVAVSDGNGNHICYRYDGLSRVTDVDTNHDVNNGGTTYCRRFRYDSTSNAFVTPPANYTSNATNLLGRMFEGATDTCATPHASSSDELFSYDANGRLLGEWSNTFNSGGYNRVIATYYLNGVLATINAPSGGNSYGGYTVTLDSDGKPTSTTWAGPSNNIIVNGITYDADGRATTVNTGSVSGDKDLYTYDPKTGNMTGYSFIVNGLGDVATLGWNANGTLGSLGITDQFNSGGSQSCTYGYDDLSRLTGANCGSLFTDTYSYDSNDNLTQNGTLSWTNGYSTSPSNNHMLGATYDSDGNVLSDGVNTYTWDAYSQILSANSGNIAATCGTSGSCMLHDAFGNIIETNTSSGYSVFFQGPGGVVQSAAVGGSPGMKIPQPGGGTLIAYGTNQQTLLYEHPDWLGTVRLTTTLPGRTSVMDTAYAPYGQAYDSFNQANNVCCSSFTGLDQLSFPGLFDTHRELMQNAGRWLTPDPVHASWNGYSYPTNPLSQTDRSGLNADEQDECMAGQAGQGCPQTSKQQQKQPENPKPPVHLPLLDRIWNWFINKDKQVTPEERKAQDYAMHAGILTQNWGGVGGIFRAPFRAQGWTTGTKSVTVYMSTEWTTEARDEIENGIASWSSVNNIIYIFVDSPTPPPPGQDENTSWVYPDESAGIGAHNTGYGADGKPLNGHNQLHHSSIGIGTHVALKDLHRHGAHEEGHNNNFGDCPNCNGNSVMNNGRYTTPTATDPTKNDIDFYLMYQREMTSPIPPSAFEPY